jgi:hypothetical protein
MRVRNIWSNLSATAYDVFRADTLPQGVTFPRRYTFTWHHNIASPATGHCLAFLPLARSKPCRSTPAMRSDHSGLWQCWLARRAGSREQGGQDRRNPRSHGRPLRSEGFEIRAAIEHVAKHRALKGCADQATIDAVELLTRRCDTLVPCAGERVIDAEVAAKPQCPVIAEGANGPTTPEADLVLVQRNDSISPTFCATPAA